MKTSIVIPVMNGRAITQDCLAALKTNTPSDHEVIVVDNGSRHKTAHMLRHSPHIDKLIRNDTNLGFVHAVNQGWESASGDVIGTINNDTVPGPAWLEEILQTLKDDAVGVTGKFGSFCDTNYRCAYQEPEIKRECDYIEGSCLFMRREVYEKVGEMRVGPAPITCDDTDYSIRVRRAGWRVVNTPKIDFKHLIGQTNVEAHATDFQQKWQTNLDWLKRLYGPCESVIQTHFPITVFLFGTKELREYTVPRTKEWTDWHEQMEHPNQYIGKRVPVKLGTSRPRAVYWEAVFSGGQHYGLEQAPTEWVFLLHDNERLPNMLLMALASMCRPDRDAWVMGTPKGPEARLFNRLKCEWDSEQNRIVRSASGSCGVYSGPPITNES